MLKYKKILFTTSTIPMSETDPVPAFVRDEAIWMKKIYPELQISVLAPHNAYSKTKKHLRHKEYDEYRFHYFWPFKWELLAGRGIQPALSTNKLLYFQLPFLFISEFFYTLFYVIKLKPDLLYAHWFTPQALTSSIVAKITGVRFVFDTQASDAIVLKKVPFSKNIVAFVCRQASAYTAPSQQTIDKLLYFSTDNNRGVILSKLHRIPYGTSPLKASRKVLNDTIQKYNLKNCETFYFIGRLVDRKGVDILIKSFSKVAKNEENYRLIIVGDGSIREELEQLVSTLGISKKVIFTGFIAGSERYALLEIADVCVIPSVSIGDQAEGLPVVFMEAISFGKITIVSDATGAHELIKPGKNSFLVKSNSVVDLQKKMVQAISIRHKNDKKFYYEVKKLSKQFQWSNIAKKRYEAFTDAG
jgi:glycosyltransferase involved in cell wall biosynthesis